MTKYYAVWSYNFTCWIVIDQHNTIIEYYFPSKAAAQAYINSAN